MHYSLMRNMRLLYIDNDVLYRYDLLRQVLLYSNYYKRLCGNSSKYTKSKQFVLIKSPFFQWIIVCVTMRTTNVVYW